MASRGRAGLRVLVVDDDEVMREVLSLVLAATGYEVSTAVSGDEALLMLGEMALEVMPDCVLTDMKMPGLCGLPLGERLREICPARTVRLAMSGSGLRTERGTGFDGFLLKPFAPEDFDRALEEALAGLAPERRPAEMHGSAVFDAPALLDELVYSKLRASMPAAQLAQLYVLCLDDAGKRVERMRMASHDGDEETFLREAHALKGGCGMLGARELHTLANRMEAGAFASTPLLNEFSAAAERLRRMLEARP